MRWGYVIFALGVSLCLVGAFIMAAGESVFGENHTGIATVVGIIGIGLIGMSGSIIAGECARSQKPKN
jgi:hypothetical protein